MNHFIDLLKHAQLLAWPLYFAFKTSKNTDDRHCSVEVM